MTVSLEARADDGPAEALARGYAAKPGFWDEMVAPDGSLRPHWQRPAAMLGELGRPELRRRWEEARRLIHEHGVSFNAYGDAQGMDRPWNLSPLPVVLDAEEWAPIAAGLVQRARLLERVLADLYGPQRLIAEGALPPELLFADPGFLRACHGVFPPGGRWLPLYGADLVRGADGRVAVLGDRTQAPSGAGYALENRIVISRALPDVFAGCNVERLARYFHTMRETLAAMAPRNRDNPRVVLLTPGPYDATYFEQAFLAQYLGYGLVEGGDLTVRDGRVCLKTLGGLQPVDVILRRLPDADADPLELRPDSLLGVPGLVQAVREGSVAVVNPLGSGLVQTGALTPFLDDLCRRLLGEALLLPSVRTWWCGAPGALAQVLERLAELVIKPAFPGVLSDPVFGAQLDAAALEALRARIRARPRDFVAQETVALSTTPMLVDDQLQPRHLVLRSYLVAASQGDGYEVMPGGLARVGGAPGALEVSMRRGGGAKDTWILASGPVVPFSLLPPPSQPVPLSRGGGDLPSRVADNLFWLGRYAERADGTARLARGIALRLADQSATLLDPGAPPAELAVLLRALAAQARLPPSSGGAAPPVLRARSWLAQGEQALTAALFDGDSPDTLKGSVQATYRLAGALRDRLSMDTWRTLTQLDQEVRHAAAVLARPGRLGAVMSALNRVVSALASFSGLAMDSMTRGQAWRFLDMGRRLERAAGVVQLLGATVGGPAEREGPLLEAVLEIADSAMTYRRRYLASLQVAPVVDLLLTDESNPRSVLFQLAALGEHIDQLPRESTGATRSPEQRFVLEALGDLRLAEVEAVCRPDEAGARPGLQALLERLERLLPALSDSLGGSYLSHATRSRQLASAGADAAGGGPGA